MTKDQILAELPKFSLTDLAIIHAMAGALLGDHTKVPDERASGASQTVFAALAAAVGAARGLQSLPAKQRAIFGKKLPGMLSFFEGSFKGWDSNKLVQMAFLKLMFDLLRDELIEIPVPLSVNSMITHLHRLPKVFDNNYPGYLENGLGGLILNKLRPTRDRLDKKPTKKVAGLLVSKGSPLLE